LNKEIISSNKFYALICAADIPLNPSTCLPFDNDFVVYWLNNKELQFTLESEKLMNDINNRNISSDEHLSEDADSAVSDAAAAATHNGL